MLFYEKEVGGYSGFHQAVSGIMLNSGEGARV